MFAQSKESSKLYNERLNPDSESTLETSSFVTRDSIPIFSQIKNVKDDKEKKEKLNQLLDALRKKLPEGFKIGAAVGEGDCFFDSVAQGLNELKDKGLVENSERFNVKSLRKDCANDARKYEDKIVKDANEGGYFVPQKNIAFPHLENIKDKKGNDVPDVQETFDKYLDYIKSVATENGPIPIRERLDIEGRMICDKYKVKIKVIGLKEQPIGDTNVIESEQGEGTNVITMVNYKNHFVPLLSNLEEDIEGAILVSREEVYGIADEESPSLIEDIKNYDLEEGAEQQSQAQNQSNRDSLQGKIHLTAIDIYHGLNQVTFGSDDSGNSRGWADIDHINNFMNKVIANNDNQLAYYISPINFGFNEEEAIRDSLKHICRRVVDNSEINDHYGTELDKPFIFIANTETVLANDPTGIDKKEGGFHWISWVLLPKKYGNLLGEEISNDQYQVFFFDSFAKRKIPERLKDGLTKGTTFVEDQITVKLLPFCKENEIVFNDNNELTGQQMNGSDCGWWAVYYALMAVYTGGVEFLDPLKGKKLSAVPLRNIMNLQEASIIQQQSLQNRENHYKGSSVSAKSSLDQSSKEFIQSTEGGNLRICLQNTVIDDIAKYLYKWTEDNNVIFGVEGCGRLPSKLDKLCDSYRS
ncbi:OTU domain-containing protein [Wolbachia endosymbiont (group B) of Eupeodes latifasciatus]|uniref:hypothetical protein n=1 Tax=Wolbachia endosymbiont (group B) of Eupeodes latifasciatus TaxID=2954013 RepID=UPI0022267190|nr:hypothetical protein [Wolbachia endosymbiont (group B) of Eupeodes latifasciatus]